MTLTLSYPQTWYEVHELLQDRPNPDLIGPAHQLHKILGSGQQTDGPLILTLLFASLYRHYSTITRHAIFDVLSNLTLRSPSNCIETLISTPGMFADLSIHNPRVQYVQNHNHDALRHFHLSGKALIDSFNVDTHRYVFPEAILFADQRNALADLENWLRQLPFAIPWPQIEPCGCLEDIFFFRPRIAADFEVGPPTLAAEVSLGECSTLVARPTDGRPL